MALVSKESESVPIINAHEFINYELELDLNTMYTPTKEEIIGMLDGGGDEVMQLIINLLKNLANVQINDVAVDRVGFKDDESALMTLNQFLEQRLVDVTPFIQSI